MKNAYVYYKEQCNYCVNRGKCGYEKKTRTFVETISGINSTASGVFGSLDFKCDYFDLDKISYSKENPAETCGW